jgi:SAM-dependent methyltransferase
MSEPTQSARRVFGERAPFYVTSAAHTDAQVLARVVELAAAQPDWRALDVATGAGHTALALAPHVRRVTAVDVTPEMLAEAAKLADARGLRNVEFCQADAHALPFADAVFDLVTCRRAAHHFTDLPRALHEMARVLGPGGRLVIDDRSVPEDAAVDELMNELDRLHDPSHVREYPPSEWGRLLADAGLTVDALETYARHRPVASLTDNAEPEDAGRIVEALRSLPPDLRRAVDLREVDGELHSTHWFVMAAAHRSPA